MPYAERTTVSIQSSKGEIEDLLVRNGCEAFSTFTDFTTGAAVVQFKMRDRLLRFSLTMPQQNEERFHYTAARGKQRTNAASYKEWQFACKSRWRGLFLCIRAKLEAVDSNIETFEEAFLPQILLPDATTVSERVLPIIEQAYTTGEMPRLDRMLPAHGAE